MIITITIKDNPEKPTLLHEEFTLDTKELSVSEYDDLRSHIVCIHKIVWRLLDHADEVRV